MPRDGVDWSIWRFEEGWHGVREEGKADEIGVLEPPIWISWDAGVCGSSWFPGTEGFGVVPVLGGSMENGFGRAQIFWFISMLCVNMRSFWSWRTKSCKVCHSSLSDSRSWWSCVTVNCTEWRYCTCFRWSENSSRGVVYWIGDSE